MCDTFVSVTDGGLLFAKNSDREANEAQVIRWFPAEHHEAGSEVRCTWISIPQVERTREVTLSQPWWMWGAEMGANSDGLVIGNEAVYTNEPYGDEALLGMDLVRLGLERAADADDAVGVIVDLLERHGQGGSCGFDRPGYTYHNSFLIADPHGAFVLETAGSEWAVEKVSGRGRSISNGLTIPGFAERHADERRGREVACEVRRRRTEASASVAETTHDMIGALRDHGSGGTIGWSSERGSLNGPCAHAGGRLVSTQTTSSWVADLRGGPLHWVTSTSAPCTSVFHPVRVGEPVDLGIEPTNLFDLESRWWRHELLHRMVLRDHARSIARFGDERDALESAWLLDRPDSAVAFERSDELERRWLEDLVETAFADERPRAIGESWERANAAAGVPEPDRALAAQFRGDTETH